MLSCSYLVLYMVVCLGIASGIKWKLFVYDSYGIEESRCLLLSRLLLAITKSFK